MGCLRRFGCLVVVIVLAALAWSNRARILAWVHGVTGTQSPAPSAAADWELLTPEGADRAKKTIEKLAERSGPVFANVSPGDLVAYVFQELSKQIPSSAQGTAAAVVGDQLLVRASMDINDLGGRDLLGPLASVFNDREPVEFGGTLAVVTPGIGEYRVSQLSVRDLSLPHPAIPKLLAKLDRTPRPPGVDDDALALVVPVHIGDVRIKNGKITLYKVVP
ncbi:MAG TPA: hypothetical protein VEI06_08790 [Gemmatimonadaceae bacterium]|nr:hypothetical protein [Gemmatimonadaceae bacterium]